MKVHREKDKCSNGQMTTQVAFIKIKSSTSIKNISNRLSGINYGNEL